MAITYDKLGRHADAEAMFAQARAKYGDNGAAATTMMYAQWGNTARALDWLEISSRARNADLQPSLDPLRKEPRFQAIKHA